MPVNLDALFFVTLAAALLAVLFDWFPGLKQAFDTLQEGQKRLFMAIAVILVTLIVWGLGCAGIVSGAPACNVDGIKNLLLLIVAAIATNQGIHMGTKPAPPGQDLPF